MWKGPEEDPGGGSNPDTSASSSQELTDLKDQFEQQSVLIAQLKEMLRRSDQSHVSQEKVEEYMNTLSKHSIKMKKQRETTGKSSKSSLDTPASQKINLLRQQVEENKVRFAERGKSQKGIEDMVTQLRAQLDDSQLLIQQTPLNVSVQDNKIEYNEHLSSQELYNILLTKEKRITDLISKVQKLETNVLDLQENVKEKDAVIDARTKAITLMTENLTKKSKGTLDALDETKEQMRKMQEHFIELEADMKARQGKLLEDLRLKNYEIAELEERNSKLEYDNLELSKKLELPTENESIQSQLELLRLENNSLKNELNDMKKRENDIMGEDGELGRLKKQLEESNKNMIKVKAQHKSKVKELNKKIENFKKISDVNAEIVRLETENSKLNQKIAELEEEKGAMQLKMVESDPGKSTNNRELEDKIAQHEEMLSEKETIISLLEAEILTSKNALSEKVTSEMASIQFEEQLERLECEIARLTNENLSIIKEKEELIEKYESLKKEKQDVQTKLDNYIQENIELIDKLEKLSAEKVSSAESIEIVEGLTQQELEAYHSNLERVAGNLKASEENLPQVDLNETVNELNEETSELLQKIELFTVERREVMDKMELLKQENGQLLLKIKEVENNRDVLAETYEQLQNEKEILDEKVETLERENDNLKSDKKDVNYSEEVEKYKQELKEAEKDSKNLQLQIEERDRYNTELNNRLADLDKVVAELETKNADLQIKISHLNELTDKHNEELEAGANKQWEDQRLIENKDNEIQKLMKERDNNGSVIADLQKLLNDKDDSFRKVSNELKERYLNLQQQIDNNAVNLEDIRSPLQAKIEELQAKNKEQLDKMKKIAANLKKKTQAYQELEGKYKEIQEKWESEQQEKGIKDDNLLKEIQNLEEEVKHLHQVLHEKSQKLEDKIQELNEQQNRNVELQNIITDLRNKTERVNLQQELLQTHETMGSPVESPENVLKSKIQELEMIIETQEGELTKYRERISRLEEGLAYVEERRASTERKANELGAQLQEKSDTCEQITASEDVLEQRLAYLSAHDEQLEKKFEEIQAENQEVTQQNNKLNEKVDKLKKKLQQTLAKLKEIERDDGHLEDLEIQNENLKKTVFNLESELKNLELEHERVLIEIKNDLERVNNEWQVQFDQVFKEKTELLIRCEKFEEELKEITEKEFAFNNELLLEYKTKLERSEIQIKAYEEEFERLASREQELEELKRIVEEKDRIIEDMQPKEHVEPSADSARALASLFGTPSQEFILEQNVNSEKQKLEEELAALREELHILKNQVKPETSIAPFFQDNSEEIQRLQAAKQQLEEQLEISQQELESVLNRKSSINNDFVLNQSYKDDSDLAKKLEESESERQYLDQELRVVNAQLKLAEAKIEKLKKNPVLKQIASDGVDSVIEEATKIVSGQTSEEATIQKSEVHSEEVVPTFNWPEQSTDTFDLAIPEEAPKVENTQAELLNKIKTLEFMLYTMEKAKDDALLQCHELSNELTRLVYERENAGQHPFQSQILSPQQLATNSQEIQQLESLEFGQTRPPTVSVEPVIEEVIEPKSAYLCYDPEGTALESQVLPNEGTVISAEDRREMQTIEFEPSQQPVLQSSTPVIEDPAQEKDAYLCYDPTSKNTFGENDDGWGWGPEEARLEEEHVQKADNKLLEDRVKQLESERDSHLDEIRQLQLKTSKLVKKLKEFKHKNEELTQAKKHEGDFFNLDDTIQEELKLQIAQIEKKLKETSAELEKEKHEKSNILKRIEVLTAANERMIEMKEKQDVEILGWQRNCKELTSKLEQLEWGGEDSFNEKPPKIDVSEEKDYSKLEELQKQIDSLNETIKDLSLDNEELQALLEEQRTLRLNAEKQKTPEIKADDYQQLVFEKETLAGELKQTSDQRQQLQEQVNDLIKKNSELLEKFDEIERGREELAAFVASKDNIIKQLNETIEAIQMEKNRINDEMNLVESEKLEYIRAIKLQESNMVTELVKEKETIFNELQEKNVQIEALKEHLESQIEQLGRELEAQTRTAQSLLEVNQKQYNEIEVLKSENEMLKQSLETTPVEELNQLRQENATLKEREIEVLEKLTRENEFLKESLEAKETDTQLRARELLEQLTEENQTLKETLERKEAEYQARNAEMHGVMEHLSQEWQMRVDQRGSDVAESWKLHLESRESEFAQLEETLRKEINELEEKCNGLVNENNELRKNVDAEIRNEVDRMSALEQQITERQQYINELTRTLQVKQNESETLSGQVTQFQEQSVEYQKILNAIVEEISDTNIPLEKDVIINCIRAIKESKEHEIHELKNALARLEQEREEVIEGYKSQLEVTRSNLEESRLAVNSLTEQLNEIRSLKDYENENSKNLHQTSIEHQQIIDSLASRLEEANNQLEACKKQIEERDNELYNLKHLVEQKETELTQNVDLVQKYETLEREYLEHQTRIQEKEAEISELRLLSEEKEKEYEKGMENITQERNIYSGQVEYLERRLVEAQNHYDEVISNKTSDYQNVSLQKSEQEQELYILNRRLLEIEQKYQEEVTEKLGENEFLHTQIGEIRDEIQRLTSELSSKQNECAELQNKIDQQTMLIEEENKQLSELRSIIENQVLKIEELKKELFEKSNDFDSLIAEMDISRSSPQKVIQDQATQKSNNDDLTEPASRAELDIALYMLHQRDVRCEELTVELTQLLEERDTLQLRLSNAIREKEEMARKLGGDVAGSSEEETKSEVPGAAEAKHEDSLTNKLFELKSVGYKRDKTILDEQEMRQIQRLSIMQQHMDEASKLPPEAAARLVDASYTLSRDVQSPSKVLLNWLWGKSTPRVNDV